MSSEPTTEKYIPVSALATARRKELHSAVRYCTLELDCMRLINTEVADTYHQRSNELKLTGNLAGVNEALMHLDFDEDQGQSFWDSVHDRKERADCQKLLKTLEDFKRGSDDLVKVLLEMRTEVELLDKFILKSAERDALVKAMWDQTMAETKAMWEATAAEREAARAANGW